MFEDDIPDDKVVGEIDVAQVIDRWEEAEETEREVRDL